MATYEARADPVLGRLVAGRPCYVPHAELRALAATPGAWRRVCRLGATVTSVETRDGAWARAIEPWGSIEALAAAAAWWRARGLRAPSSPAGLVREAAPAYYRWQRWSVQVGCYGYVAGGWQEADVVGVIAGPHVVYDLRRAYRWAWDVADCPRMEAVRVARRYEPTAHGVALLELRPWPGAPWPLRRGGRCLVATEDLRRYGPPPWTRWCGGYVWPPEAQVERGPLADVLDALPPACQRSYWGIWAASTPLTITWASGKVTALRPRGGNPVWAHAITAAVRRRLAEIRSIYRYVDAVIVPEEVPLVTGDGIGAWRLVRYYPHGVWIGWPGAYGPAHGPPDRLAGIPTGGTHGTQTPAA